MPDREVTWEAQEDPLEPLKKSMAVVKDEGTIMDHEGKLFVTDCEKNF